MMLRRATRILRHYGPPAGAVLAVILAWYAVTAWLGVPGWLLPSPQAVVAAAYEHGNLLPKHTAVTLVETLLGLAVSLAVGVPLAIAVVWSPFLRRTIYPLLLGLQSVPKVALAPLFLIWVGYGMPSKVLIVASIAFFPIVVDTVTGLAIVERDLLDMVKVLRASTLQTFLKIRIPSAMPYFFSGVKVAVTLAVIGAVVGEFVGSDVGLGYLMLVSGSQLNTAMVFVCLVILSLMGAILFEMVEALQRIACPWSLGE
jgi:NitT/TauT family transport system permease protein